MRSGINYSRIEPSLDVERLRRSHVVMVGGAYHLVGDLVRSGLGRATLIDFDRASASNVPRQDFDSRDVGASKTAVWSRRLQRINPHVRVVELRRDVCSLWPDEVDSFARECHLIVAATDFFPAQARANQIAMEHGIPILKVGMYQGGRAGELTYWVPHADLACCRCNLSARYRAFTDSPSIATTSLGGTIADLRLADAVALQLALAILTRGAPNRFGKLTEQLGRRNFFQVKIDPEYRLGQRDLFGEHLGTNPANFSFTTIALPMVPEEDCPDCQMHRSMQGRATARCDTAPVREGAVE
jgi:molybdopterin/thiamine biosynthesis adenylyltransferase